MRSFFNIPECDVFKYLFYNFCLFYKGNNPHETLALGAIEMLL